MGSRSGNHRTAGSRWAAGTVVVAVLVGLVGGSVMAPAAAAQGDRDGQAAESVIEAATRYLGVPYRLGREGPDLFDCSGLLFRAFSDVGRVGLIGGRRTRAAVYMRMFARQGQYVTDEADARRGDLVVWGGGKHIGIYLGDGMALSAVITGVSIHGIDRLTQPLSGFLRVDWDGDRSEGGAPVDLGPLDPPEVPVELVPASGWAPELPQKVARQALPAGVEREDMRTAGSRTFRDADGTFTTEIFSRPIFHKPAGTTDWQPIDLRFLAADERRVAARVESSPVAVEIDAVRRRTSFLRLANGEQVISMALAGGAANGPVQPALGPDGRYADYDGLFGGRAGLRLFPRADGVKAFLVLAEAPAEGRFDFVLEVPGLAGTLGRDGSIALHRADTDEADADEVVARILPPLAISSRDADGHGGGISADAAKLELTDSGDGSFVVSVVVDRRYLGRVLYPAYVDLTVAGLGAAAGDAGSTFALSSWPAANFANFQRPEWPGYPELWHGRLPGRDIYSEAYLRFLDPAGSLQGIDVDSATLRLLPYWQFDRQGPTWISQPAEDWDASMLTWDNRPAAATELGSFDTQAGGWADIELTDHLRAIVAGEQPDHGLLLHADVVGNRGWKRIVAPDGDAALGPRLVVRWRNVRPLPVEPYAGAWSAGQLAWSHAAVAPEQTRYEVEVFGDDVPGEPIRSGVVKGRDGRVAGWTVPDDALRPGTSYLWRVRVKYGKGMPWSEWSTAVPLAHRPAAGSDQAQALAEQQRPEYDEGDSR